MMTRKILHLDLDAFFCCVEELRDPALKGKPFAVGGRPDQRGVVASCSYPARRFGVHSAMPMSRAVRQCPGLIIVPHDFKAYREYSRRVMDILHTLTPLVEQISIDEAFLDVSALADDPEQIARGLQVRINDELKLSCSLGVAGNKLVAKIANNIGKDAKKKDDSGLPPNAIKIVPLGAEAQFLAPLPTRELWGVGPRTEELLAAMNIHTIGDIAARSEVELIRRFGKHGHDLWRHAQGMDERDVETERETKQVSREITYVQDVRDAAKLLDTLRELSDDVSAGLRGEGLRGTTIKLKLRWSDFKTLTRQTTLLAPTDDAVKIYDAAERLLEKHRPAGKAVRLIGVGVSHFLAPSNAQLSLWSEGQSVEQSAAGSTAADQQQPEVETPPKAKQLQSALDALRHKFGEAAVKRASDLKDDEDR